MIAEGRIAVNGEVLTTPATLLTSLQGITVDGAPISETEQTRLFLFHKPAGCLTAERDFSGRKTIYDFLPTDLPRLMPVGMVAKAARAKKVANCSAMAALKRIERAHPAPAPSTSP